MTGLPDIAFLHGGTHAQLATLDDPALTPYRMRALHVRHLREADLTDAEVVLVADRLRPDLLLPRADLLLACLRRGATLVVFGENHAGDWLPDVRESHRPTNFWWWRTGEDHRLHPRHPEHPAWDFLTPESMTWHYHAVFATPPGATTLMDLHTESGALDGSILYIDDTTSPGRLLATTMDPVYHHGSGFMPGATQLLYSTLQWATR